MRQRLDISLIDGQLGFYEKEQKQKLVDIEKCLLLTESLNQYLEKVRNLIKFHHGLFKSKRISLRLRAAPDGTCGIWIDSSHQNIKEFLEDKKFLLELLKIGLVEIGQKHKPLFVAHDGALKLDKKFKLSTWINTFDKNLNSIPLFSTISSFTQPGVISNKILIQQTFKLLENIETKTVIEFFSGMGNFTLPMLSLGLQVRSFEISDDANNSINKTLENYPDWKARLEFKKFNLYSKNKVNFFDHDDLLIVDPPRSGLGFILDQLDLTPSDVRPKHILYISCYAETMVSDLKTLFSLGYTTPKVLGIDQFPYSKHCEWMCLLSKIDV